MKTDIKRGNKGELLVKSKIEARGGKFELIGGKFQPYDADVELKGTRFFAEIKTDYRFKDTGNIAFEKNAMDHSKTQIWFYVLDGNFPEVHLIDLAKAQKIAPGAEKQGYFGDNGEYVYCVPYGIFKSQISLGTF